MFHKYLKPAIYLALAIIPFFIVFFRPKWAHAPGVMNVSVQAIGPFQGPIGEVRKLLSYHQIYDHYKRSLKETSILRSQLVRLQELVKENARLGDLVETRRPLTYTTVAASVIGRDPSNWNASLIIDRGSKDGLKAGMSVISPLGAVGRIVEVGSNTAKVLLLTDPTFSVAGVVQRSRESGLLQGSLQGLCRLQYLTEDADVRAGDRVITSKLSLSFPEGILVGDVKDVQASQSRHSVECLIEPAVTFSQLEDVLVIKK